MKRQQPTTDRRREDESVLLLTPHTLRLLKLIQDGSQEHASMAALQLASISAQSSPLVLWDVLGRLLAFLLDPNWQTRQNASGAMEGVARHLPLASRQQFLSSAKQQDDSSSSSSVLWLTLQDFQPDLIIQQGRLLWAFTADQFAAAREEDSIRQLDQQHLAENKEGDAVTTDDDFVQRRVQQQRCILARRIGLSGLLQATGGTMDACLLEAITSNDFKNLPNPTVCSQPPPPQSRPKKRSRRHEKPKEDPHSSVRALLVLEMKREQTSDSAISLTHNNPQILLATELLFRLFDPTWYIRHGALMGLLALLKAWHGNNTCTSAFGAWPHDILVRCLCVVLLDRFGDYSGTTTSTSNAQSGSVVAPVRETAGQLVSMVWHMAPESIQKETLQALYRLASQDNEKSTDWEVRHGALVALKYICTVQVTGKSATRTFVEEIAQVASNCLQDEESDDVQSVAAQILAMAFSGDDSIHDPQILTIVWTALQKTRRVSSSLLDLITLCSLILEHRNSDLEGMDGGPSMLFVFGGYVDHDLASVRIAALRSVAQVVHPIWSAGADHGGSLGMVCDALDRLQEKLFLMFFEDQLLSSSQQIMNQQKGNQNRANVEGSNTSSLRDLEVSADLCAGRTLAWDNLVRILRQRATREDQSSQVQSLVYRLTLLYFGISPEERADDNTIRLPRGDTSVTVLLDAGKALSDIFLSVSNESMGCHLDLVEITIKTMLRSPWLGQCEAACLLFCSLADKVSNDPTCLASKALLPVLESCRQSITELLTLGHNELAPLCLAVDICNHTREVLQDRDMLKVCHSSFLNGFALSQKNTSDTKIANAVDTIRNLWKHTIAAKGGREEVFATTFSEVIATRSSMRWFALLAGAVLAGNNGTIPLKKATPVIRPLMTSLKNEKDPLRRLHSCSFAADMLSLMYQESRENANPFHKAREKVLSTMCDAISSDASSDIDDEQGESAAFARVIQSYLNKISSRIHSLQDIPPIWSRLQSLQGEFDENCAKDGLFNALALAKVVLGGLPNDCALASATITMFLPKLTLMACRLDDDNCQSASRMIVRAICADHTSHALQIAMPGIIDCLSDRTNDSYRLSACQTLQDIVDTVGMGICTFVRRLLRVVMSLMADPSPDCARLANAIFACLIRVAPLVPCEDSNGTQKAVDASGADSVIDHLIHGRPLPPYELPPRVKKSLRQGGVSLRPYQMEGVAWLKFLQSVNLNGALCDSMGLGKTLQALIGIAISHVDACNDSMPEGPKSLVVCPASVVGHWEAEIERFFPNESIFTCLSLIGNAKERKALWESKARQCNIVVTSYSVLRADVAILTRQCWRFCCLDEGHLIRNRNTVTARASRRIRAHHKLILTGTPVQNKVQEIFAAFDFLMPNFLGSSTSFAREFANPITKGHLAGASAESIGLGGDKLKVLHQQVLPFILRREKHQVLKELPPKCVSTVPCRMSVYQRQIQEKFLASEEGKKSVHELETALRLATSGPSTDDMNIGSNALRSLLFLRLLCTHPSLVEYKQNASSEHQVSRTYDVDMSGKFLALLELLGACGIYRDQVTGADNDSSLLYCQQHDDGEDDGDDVSMLLDPIQASDSVIGAPSNTFDSGSKCLVFAQFTQSLDAVEELLVKRHMPSLRYLRLDGRVPVTKRSAIVDAFNNDPSIKLMLLTTRVGGLGLNLTGADTVCFLESDFNPHADLQAADRAHRIGQSRTVNVYRLVTKDTIEEKIMSIQEKKLAMSNAIVNTDNSTMFSMGTDRLLDIFTSRTESHQKYERGSEEGGVEGYNLDALVERYKDEYSVLGMKDFIKALRS
ncbi:CHD3-type chromatin-remodeling factor [Seminavis robusta]|uniref:CHD3-type chromatin-remodeling factor n=1 Tax=Seminavis robusta TaxID=568900 RepID=A0A9N8H566_9STRA|nr:CHD3-type chromatin-remodeling factor [Seminavis robusta]|eukprot:Sro19_g013190.1 CHD3-type chromatin-remodeling factor (1810) ;mRNA; f:5154-10826